MALERQPTEPGRQIRQQRSRKTYNALVATGFKLLQKRELEAITISELAAKAGYSVGAFYSRFRSKDEFFDAMVARHLEERTADRNQIFATASNENLVYALVDGHELIAKASGRDPPSVGGAVTMRVRPEHIHVFDAETEQALT